MPRLTVGVDSDMNRKFANEVAKDNPGCRVWVDSGYLEIECPGELRISADHAWKAWAKTSIVQDPELFIQTWRRLLRSCTGYIVQWTEREVVFSDKRPPKYRGGRALNVIIAPDIWERLDRAVRGIPHGTKRQIVEAALEEYLRVRCL